MKIRRFFESVYHDNAARRGDVRALWSDVARYAGNKVLRPAEEILIRRNRRSDLPIVFIVGVPRSGTTLLFQLICRHLAVAYPSNFISRFWMAPVIGAIISNRLSGAVDGDAALESRFGGTATPMSPHEFSWFWEYWTEFGGVDDHPPERLQTMDWQSIKRELEGLAGWFGRPLVFKSINYVDYNVAWVAELLPQSRFVWIRRDPKFVAQSIYETRQARYDDAESWWSVRPADVAEWLGRPAAEQIAHQIHDIERAIQRGFEAIGESRTLLVDYDQLTRDPRSVIDAVASLAGVEPSSREISELELQARNEMRLPAATFEQLVNALEEIE